MERLVADFVNDPDNDFDLMVEILDNNQEVAMIRKIDGKYKLIVFENSNGIEISLEWLNSIVSKL